MSDKGQMTVSEMGRLGGNATKKKYGRKFYEAIGKKGGSKVKKLIEAGKAQETKDES